MMPSCLTSLNMCIGSMVVAIGALAWCLKFELQSYVQRKIEFHNSESVTTRTKKPKKKKKEEVHNSVHNF